jgi:hypothetical protein
MKALVVFLGALLVVLGFAMTSWPFSSSKTSVVSPTHPPTAAPTAPKSTNQVYFELKEAPVQDAATVQLDIVLKGEDGQRLDAADLKLEVGKNLRIVNVFPGQTFRQYPRVFFNATEAVITGIADLAGSQAQPGEANRIFASLVVEKVAPALPALLKVNQQETKAYLEGLPILNSQLNLKEIIL